MCFAAPSGPSHLLNGEPLATSFPLSLDTVSCPRVRAPLTLGSVTLTGQELQQPYPLALSMCPGSEELWESSVGSDCSGGRLERLANMNTPRSVQASFDQGETGDRKDLKDEFSSLSPSVDYSEMQGFHVASLEMSCTEKPAVFSCDAVANSVTDLLMFAFLPFLPPFRKYGDG